MKNKLEVKVGNKKLVVFVNDWKNDMPKEIYVSIADNNGVFLQDICMIREHYHFNPNKKEFEIDSDLVDVKVWADSNDKDYTDEFCIGVYSEEEN